MQCKSPNCAKEADTAPLGRRGARRLFCSDECYAKWRKEGVPKITPFEIAQLGRRVIAWHSKGFTEQQQALPVYFRECLSLLTILGKARKYAIASKHPLYAYVDHVSLTWIMQSNKTAVSSWLLTSLSDLRIEVMIYTYRARAGRIN